MTGSRAPAFSGDLAALISGRDAELVDIPVIQPADQFLDMAGEDLRRRIFLTENENGESLCLRPEFTIPGLPQPHRVECCDTEAICLSR